MLCTLKLTHFVYAQLDTMLLSCGVADLVATCTSGRNYKCGLAFAPLLRAAHEARVIQMSNMGSIGGLSIGGMAVQPRPQPHAQWKEQIRSIWSAVDDMVCAGQKPQGVGTCAEVIDCLQQHFKHDPQQLFAQYPLFSRIHEVVVDGDLPERLFEWK